MKFKIFLCVVLCSTINLFAQNNFVYVNDDNAPNRVSAFSVNPDGSLTLIAGSPFLTGGNGSGFNKIDAGKITTATVKGAGFVYAANNADGTATGFSVNPQTGSLVIVPGSPFNITAPNSGPALASSPNGQFLFAVDDVNPVVRVFSIAGDTGALTEASGSPFNLGAPAQTVKVSPSGRFLAVGLESNTVEIFAIKSNGALTPAAGSPVPTSGTPTGIDINCHSNRLFVSNAGSPLINAFQMEEDGSLAPVPGSPFPSGGSGIDVALTLTPNNRFLLTSDTFSDAVSSLAVAPNGSLQAAPGSPFGGSDFEGKIETTRAGNFVYAALFAQDAVDGWSISATGTLAPVPGRPFSTGGSPLGEASMVTFPAPSCSAHRSSRREE